MRGPPEVWVTSGQNFTPRLLQSYCKPLRLFQKIFFNHQMKKVNFEVQMKHLRVIGEITVMVKFYLCLHDFSEFSEL